MEALIANIQHFNVHDGTGFRTVVFFQGCTLQCRWCQNPELKSMMPSIMYHKRLCVRCGACLGVCKKHAIYIANNGELVTDTNKCGDCFFCEEECYYLARRFSSRKMPLEEVVKEVIKDEVFFRRSNGGVTLSGGEPFVQHEFCLQLIKDLSKKGISVNVETAGYVPWHSIEKSVPYVDTFLYDFKLMDSKKQLYWLGTDTSIINDNLKKLSAVHSRIVIRIPLIPGINDTDEEFEAMMNFLDSLKKIQAIHILPFHQLGSFKYKLIGENYKMIGGEENNQLRIAACVNIAEQHGYFVDVGGTAFPIAWQNIRI